MRRNALKKAGVVFSSDISILSWEFQHYHSHISRVIVNPDTGEVDTLCIHRPTVGGIREKKDTIVIPFDEPKYEPLLNTPNTAPPFCVYAWKTGLVDDGQRRGVLRGKFRLERRNDLRQFLLHRIPGETALTPTLTAPVAAFTRSSKRAVAATHNAAFAALQPQAPPKRTRATATAATTAATTGCGATNDGANRADGGVATDATAVAVTRGPGRPRKDKDPARFGLRTTLRDVTYRSRKEARFALALLEMDIPFSYEPVTFSRPSGGKYMPDFFLPRQQLWVELKPQRPHIEEELKCEEMSAVGFRVACMYGEEIGAPPFSSEERAKRDVGYRDYAHKNGLRGMAWINGEKLAGDTVFVVGRSTRKGENPLEEGVGDCMKPHLDQVCSTRDTRWDTPTILNAFVAAAAEKF